MGEMFEMIEHTADIGIRAWGRNCREAYANIARGMLSLMADKESVRFETTAQIEVTGSDAVELLVAWLHEILYRFDAHGEVFGEVEISEFSEWRIKAILRGESFDPARHHGELEIKAVTWHGARVDKEDDRWVAEIILDV